MVLLKRSKRTGDADVIFSTCSACLPVGGVILTLGLAESSQAGNASVAGVAEVLLLSVCWEYSRAVGSV